MSYARMAAAAVVILASGVAHADPPAVGSDDWNVMAPYKEWVTTRHDPEGRWCCDIGDGRPVEARINGDHWEAKITKEKFPDAAQSCSLPAVGPGAGSCPSLPPDGLWLQVPDEKIVRQANPTGVPILWLYQGRVQCFAPPDGS